MLYDIIITTSLNNYKHFIYRNNIYESNLGFLGYFWVTKLKFPANSPHWYWTLIQNTLLPLVLVIDVLMVCLYPQSAKFQPYPYIVQKQIQLLIDDTAASKCCCLEQQSKDTSLFSLWAGGRQHHLRCRCHLHHHSCRQPLVTQDHELATTGATEDLPPEEACNPPFALT